MLRVSLVLMMLFTSPVKAGFQDGNSLYQKCRGSEMLKQYCMAYSVAVADVMDSDTGLYGFKACFPRRVTAGQIEDIVRRWLASNPQYRHYSADSLVAEALSEAFPC